MFLLPGKHKELPFIIFVAFILTFIGSRAIAYFGGGAFSIVVKGVHIHHLAYGIVILSLVGLYALVFAPKDKDLYKTAFFYGVGLGMVYDEFGMWLHLRDDYWIRQTYDAVGIICALFINYLYFDSFWRKVGRKLFWPVRKVRARISTRRGQLASDNS